jgi:hypothetical protein
MRLAADLIPASESYGRLYGYNKAYDRITTKTERPLQSVDRIKYNITTSDDPIIQQVQTTVGAIPGYTWAYVRSPACIQGHRSDLCNGCHP